MKLKGKDLIQWIQDNQLEEKHVYMHTDNSYVVKSISAEQMAIDECGDILIIHPEYKEQ